MYAAINAIVLETELPLASACEILEVSRSAYYAWRVGEPSQREQQEATLTPLVRAVFWKHRRRYGARHRGHRLARRIPGCDLRRVRVIRWAGLTFCQRRSLPMP